MVIAIVLIFCIKNSLIINCKNKRVILDVVIVKVHQNVFHVKLDIILVTFLTLNMTYVYVF